MDDLISRSKAIRWVKAECNPYGQPTLDYESGIKVIEHLERMPSVQPEQRWIPVTERLPENDDEVLLTVEFKKHRFVYSGSYSKDVDGDPHWYSLWDEFRVGREREKIIAWMPLPKPYEG